MRNLSERSDQSGHRMTSGETPLILASDQLTQFLAANGVDPAPLTRLLLQFEIEQMLYAEANALDERRFRDWLDFFTDDASYWMPIRSTRSRDDGNEFTEVGEGAFFDEDRQLLEARVYKLETDFSWAEDPPSRTRHQISNIRLVEDTADSVQVYSNFVVYRSRLDTDKDLWVGRRRDYLRSIDHGWKIARREIFLDQTVLKSKNLSTFF